jgi:CO dehydrogenase/acetyl-CoA synthase alpha subunit
MQKGVHGVEIVQVPPGASKREDIKEAVKKREIRLLVATDAACEGLNIYSRLER